MRRLKLGAQVAATLALTIGLNGCDDGGVSGVNPSDGGGPDGQVGVEPTPEEDSGLSTGEPDAGSLMDAGSGDGDGQGDAAVGDGDGDGTFDAGGDGDVVDSGTPEPSTRIEAEDFDEGPSVGVEGCTEGGENVMDVGNGEYIAFYNFTFDGIKGFKVRAASEGHPATFKFRKNSETGTVIATCSPPVTAGWQDWTTVTCDVEAAVTGTGTLYITFEGEEDNGHFLPNINWIDLIKDSSDQIEQRRIEAEEFIGDLNIGAEDCSEGGWNLMDVGNGEWTAYDNFNFNGINAFNARVASGNFAGKLHFRKGSPTGQLIATCDAPATGGWQNWTTVYCEGTAASGTGALYLVFEGPNPDSQLPNVNWFESVYVPGEDAGLPGEDAGAESDAGSGELDGGTPVEDAGSEQADAGPPAPTPFVGYHFDETSGSTAADFTGGGHDITTTGTVDWVDGKSGKAMQLDGDTAFASLPVGIMSNVSDFTISTWVKLDQLFTWSRIFDFGFDQNNYMFLTPRAFDDQGVMRFEIKVNGDLQVVTSTYALGTGGWQHVAVKRAGNTVSLYINGVQVGSNPNVTHSPAELGNTPNNWLGKSEFPDHLVKGAIDDFAIYDEALTDLEIADLAGVSDTAPAPATLLFGYKFDETSGTSVSDYSGHGMDGSLAGHAAFVTGRFGNAVNLDNTDPNNDGQVDMPAGAVSTLHDYSMTIWVNPTQSIDWAQLIDFGSDTGHYLAVIPRAGNMGNTLRVTIKNGDDEQFVNAPAQLPVGSWTHVAITSAGNSVSLYVNGELAGMNPGVAIDPADLQNTSKNALGFSQWGDHHFNGLIDEFAVYSGVLTPQQVKDLANQTP